MQKRLQNRLEKSKQILFLCYGNINRSALAHVIAEQSLETTGIKFFSAGFHTPDNRPADPNMVKISAENGVDLANCRSTTISEDLVNQADIILAMEIQHLERLTSTYPSAKNKGFLLGTLTVNESFDTEIKDPYGQDSSIFQEIFQRIRLSINELSKYVLRAT